MNADSSEIAQPLPLIVPSSLQNEKGDIVDAFRAEGLDVAITGFYVTKAAGPLPDANFWVDLTRHAASFPIEQFIDRLEGAVGVALLAGFDRIRKWAGHTLQIRVHFRLPTQRQPTHYIIPDEPEAKLAIRAISRHYKSVRTDPANEYFWVDGRWMSSKDYFRRDKR